MMPVLNWCVYALLNPLSISLLGIALAITIKLCFLRSQCNAERKKIIYICSWVLVMFSLVWLWFWSTKVAYKCIGGWLEQPYAKYATKDGFENSGAKTWGPLVEEYPCADAIVLLGGGMGCHTNGCPYSNMCNPADRVWHAVRLYRAGKAPLIIASGISDEYATKPLLEDFGIPESAMIFESDSVNTEQNAKFVEKVLGANRKVLLVTSAWHMRRSELLFRKYAPGLRVVPAPTDFEAMMTIMHPDGFRLAHLLPDPATLAQNCAMFKELLGLFGYTYIR